MHNNTPPRGSGFGDDDLEVIPLDGEERPDDDDDLEEVTLEDLESSVDDIEPTPDNSSVTFHLHEKPVFSCALHPTQNWAATGGQDDCTYVWSTETGHLLHTIDEHKDTVVAVRFSHDGSYLASGDMSGLIVVLKAIPITTPPVEEEMDDDFDDGASDEGAVGGIKQHMKLRKVWETEMGDMSWMLWHPAANVLFGGSESGEVFVWRIPSGDCKILPGHGSRCEAGDISNDGKKLFTAYDDATIKLWDLKTCNVLLEVDDKHPMGHQSSVMAVACDKHSPLFMSGSSDGKIIFSTINGPVGTVEADGHVECLAFSPGSEIKLAASGTLFGEIAIWDFTKYVLRARCEYEMSDGASNIKWLNATTLLATTLIGYVHIYDGRSGIKKLTLYGHNQDVYDVAYSADKNILLTVSEDGTAKIFDVPDFTD